MPYYLHSRPTSHSSDWSAWSAPENTFKGTSFIHSLSRITRINSPCIPCALRNRITSSPFLMSVLVPDWAAMSDYVPVFPVGRCSPPVWPLIVASELGIMTSCGVYTHGSTMNNNNISGAYNSRHQMDTKKTFCLFVCFLGGGETRAAAEFWFICQNFQVRILRL